MEECTVLSMIDGLGMCKRKGIREVDLQQTAHIQRKL